MIAMNQRAKAERQRIALDLEGVQGAHQRELSGLWDAPQLYNASSL